MSEQKAVQWFLFILAPLAFLAGVAAVKWIHGTHPVVQFVGAAAAAAFIAGGVLIGDEHEADAAQLQWGLEE